jgi:hypothetical protein
MSDTFHLLDLPSQALAIQRLLSGQTEDQKLAWLSMHGKLSPFVSPIPGARQVYLFESTLGFHCGFFFDGDEFVFMGNHTTYTVKH